MAGESKTETATPKKRRDERKKDAVAVSTLIGSLFTIQFMAGTVVSQVGKLLRICFSYMAAGSPELVIGSLNTLFKTVVLTFVVAAGPFLAVTAVLAVGVTFFQTKMLEELYQNF